MAAGAGGDVRRTRHGSPPRRAARTALAGREAARGPTASPRVPRLRPLHDAEEPILAPHDRARPADARPARRALQASAYRGDDELVFAHPQKGTPLDASTFARAYMRPALKAAGIKKAVPALPRPPPHVFDARGSGRQPAGIRPAQGRTLARDDDGALHPRSAGSCFRAPQRRARRACLAQRSSSRPGKAVESW